MDDGIFVPKIVRKEFPNAPEKMHPRTKFVSGTPPRVVDLRRYLFEKTMRIKMCDGYERAERAIVRRRRKQERRERRERQLYAEYREKRRERKWELKQAHTRQVLRKEDLSEQEPPLDAHEMVIDWLKTVESASD